MHSYSGTITENSPVDSTVALDQQILVHDADIGENAEFSLSLVGEGSNFFTVEKVNNTRREQSKYPNYENISNHRFSRALAKLNKNKKANNHFLENFENLPSYIIRFVGPNILDREIQNYFEFAIVARDKGGLMSEAKLQLYVGDQNDNPPIFEKIALFKDMGLEVMEYTNDLEIYFIDRLEPDTLTYPIRHHIKDVDNVQASASNTNYEIMQLAEGVHIGTPRFMDANKSNKTMQPPSSPRSRYRRRNNEKPYPIFSVLENVEVGSVIMKLTATDDDYEENAQVMYKILTETYISPRIAPKKMHKSKFFGIDMATGELRVYRPLPAQAEILLNVSAVDTGGLTDHTAIKFKVTLVFLLLT